MVVNAIAESIGITGSIRREEQYNITLTFEGENEWVNAFIGKLQEMYSQGIYSSIKSMSDEILNLWSEKTFQDQLLVMNMIN